VLRLTRGSPPDLTLKAVRNVRKPIPIRRPRSGKGPEGGRLTDSAEGSGPVKPGNGLEDKTPTTRKEAWMSGLRRWGMRSRGREVMVTAMRSRNRVARKRWNQKAKRRYPNPTRDADQMERLEGHEGSGSGH